MGKKSKTVEFQKVDLRLKMMTIMINLGGACGLIRRQPTSGTKGKGNELAAGLDHLGGLRGLGVHRDVRVVLWPVGLGHSVLVLGGGDLGHSGSK